MEATPVVERAVRHGLREERVAGRTNGGRGCQATLQHDAYIGAWVKVLRGDKRAIFTTARLAQEAADHLLPVGSVQEAAEALAKVA